MRKDFQISQEDLDKIIEASKPVPYMVFGGIPPTSPQENANMAWQALGEKMGFKYMTVQPNGKGNRFFSAEVSE